MIRNFYAPVEGRREEFIKVLESENDGLFEFDEILLVDEISLDDYKVVKNVETRSGVKDVVVFNDTKPSNEPTVNLFDGGCTTNGPVFRAETFVEVTRRIYPGDRNWGAPLRNSSSSEILVTQRNAPDGAILGFTATIFLW